MQHVVDGLALLGQQDGHAVGSVAVGQVDNLKVFRLAVSEIFFRVHHGHFFAAVAFKAFVFRVASVELLCPGSLEVDGVQQVADGIGLERLLVQHFGNHFLRVVAGPLVDDA